MKQKILPIDCKTMFDDKLNSLSMKELGIELKHFAVGTAPECPSYLVNQDVMKNIIIEKFMGFFNDYGSQGLEVIFLKSNYGNGKSHFIKTIYSFLSHYENILAKKISLKQEKTDLKIKILEGVGQKVIKQCATFFVDNGIEESESDEKDTVLITLSENLGIDLKLADLLYQVVCSEDIAKQTQATAILKGNYLSHYPKNFKLKKEDLNHDFYISVIRLVCKYLLKNGLYLIIVFDEYEHIYSWQDVQARNTFFSDIKYFTDHIETFKNLFFVFAESEAADSNTEVTSDPAYVSRKKSLTYPILDISSDEEIEKLFRMIKDRYEKYYEISLEEYFGVILQKVKDDPQVKTNSNYRNYTQVIMRILEQYKNTPANSKRIIGNKLSTSQLYVNKITKEEELSFAVKWKLATSISKKTILCDAIEYLLHKSTEKIMSKSKKSGVYKTRKDFMIKVYYIMSTDNPSNADFIKRYNNVLKKNEESKAGAFTILYPFKTGVNDGFVDRNVIFYCIAKVPNVLESIYKRTEIVENVDEYLQQFESGC